MRDIELVVRVVLVELAGGLELVAHARELGVRQRGLLLDGVDAGLVERDRIEARKEADVTDDGLVVLVVAVAVGAHIDGQADVERRTPVDDGLGVLGDLVVEDLGRRVVVGVDGVLIAHGDAAAAAHAAVVVDARHVDLALLSAGELDLADLVEAEGAVRADLRALAAADALGGLHVGLARRVLVHLSGAGAAAHADVLHGAAEARALVALEVREADHDVGVHEGAADLCRLDVLAALDGNLDLVEALDTVGDDGVAAGLERVEAVGVGAVQVVEAVLAPADVERVAVGDEGLAAELANDVDDGARVVGAQVAEVARLAEVHLYGDELVGKVDLLDARGADQALELVGQTVTQVGVQVAEIYL